MRYSVGHTGSPWSERGLYKSVTFVRQGSLGAVLKVDCHSHQPSFGIQLEIKLRVVISSWVLDGGKESVDLYRLWSPLRDDV